MNYQLPQRPPTQGEYPDLRGGSNAQTQRRVRRDAATDLLHRYGRLALLQKNLQSCWKAGNQVLTMWWSRITSMAEVDAVGCSWLCCCRRWRIWQLVRWSPDRNRTHVPPRGHDELLVEPDHLSWDPCWGQADRSSSEACAWFLCNVKELCRLEVWICPNCPWIRVYVVAAPMSYGGDNEVIECSTLQCPKSELEDLVHITKQTTVWCKSCTINSRRTGWEVEEERFLTFVSLALVFVVSANAEERATKSLVVLCRIPLLWPLSGQP